MKSSAQKTGYSIAVMIGIIIAAGIGVDWWDAHQSRKLGTPVEAMLADEAALTSPVDRQCDVGGRSQQSI